MYYFFVADRQKIQEVHDAFGQFSVLVTIEDGFPPSVNQSVVKERAYYYWLSRSTQERKQATACILLEGEITEEGFSSSRAVEVIDDIHSLKP